MCVYRDPAAAAALLLSKSVCMFDYSSGVRYLDRFPQCLPCEIQFNYTISALLYAGPSCVHSERHSLFNLL